MNQKGFTLIEIMVAMVIIMALSTLALTAFNNSNFGKKRSQNVVVRSNLGFVRSRAAIYYDSAGGQSYGKGISSCTTGLFSDSLIQQYITEINAIPRLQQATPVCATDSTGQFWAMAAALYDGVTFYCVDSQGADKVGTVNTGTAQCQ